VIDGRVADLDVIAASSRPLAAWLDCTGGWRSQQRWDVVPLADLVSDGGQGRSIQVTSATGYSRLFARSAADEAFVCVGYDGQPLRRGHGAPLRLVVPGRRGPWWVKWITSIELTDRPAWLQLPFPPT
jgi:DMSO/TMAO reductase YedYZ molybdopterin-dependent catalytic subunit